MKILTVVGARPQFIKAAAVSRAISANGDIREIIVHTGQHFDSNMSEVFFEEMRIPTPAYKLEVNSLSHAKMTGRMMEGLEEIIEKEKPDHVLVYGDTNTTLAAALTAQKMHHRVAHVEAGLRSFNMAMPEEVNRILTDRISNLLFCPTDTAIKNLSDEGYQHFDCNIVKSGDVMLDAAKFYAEKSAEKSTIRDELGLDSFVLATMHRQENTDDPAILQSIFDGLNKIAEETALVIPLHPRTRKVLEGFQISDAIKIIDPVGYFDMLELLKHCQLVITDSGGLQKEAYFFQKHCVTVREQTEWLELVDNGYNVVAGTDAGNIYTSFQEMSTKESDFDKALYGDGHASEIVVRELLRYD